MKKIALVYDRVNTSYGGAEQVLLALHQAYPEADLFSSLYHQKKAQWAQVFNVKTSFLQKIPGIKSMHRLLAIFMPFAFEFLDFSEYDIIISVSSAEAKGLISRKDQLHISYLLTPPRYLYHYQKEYLKRNFLLKLPIIKSLAKLSLNYLKNWDQIAINRADVIIPISKVVGKRIEKYYGINYQKVIYPPVNTDLLKNSKITDEEKVKTKKTKKDSDYYLIISRLVSYKNIDIAIRAVSKIKKNLVIIGEGPQEKRLKKLARTLEKKLGYKKEELIVFKKNLNSDLVKKYYLDSLAVLMPGVDDFGITALESNLYGKAVIINQNSGAAELIKNNIHGIIMKHREEDSSDLMVKNLIIAIKKFEKIKFNPQILIKNALKYDTNSFVFNFDQNLKKLYSQKIKEQL